MMQDREKKNSEEQSRFKKSKILRIISSGLIAFGLWFFVITVERTETEQGYSNVEVVLDGETVLEERGLKIISDKDLTVKLRLNGRRSVLNSLRSSDIKVRVDLTRIYEAGKKSLPYEIVFPGDVDSSGIEVVSRTPDAVTLVVADWANKRVDLRNPQIVGTPAPGYRVGVAEMPEDETVTLSGPKSIIDQIASAGVVVDVEGVSETQEIRKGFVYYDDKGNVIEDTDGVRANPEKALVRVPILQEKNVELKMPVSIGENVDNAEFTLNVIVKMADGRESAFDGVLLIKGGEVIPSGATLQKDENGQIYLDLGKITAFGSPVSVNYVTEGELPDLELTTNFEKVYGRHEIDLQQDKVDCDVESVTVSVISRQMELKQINGVIIRNTNPQYGYTPSMLTVYIMGFPEDLVGVTSGNIDAVIAEEVTQSGMYQLTVTVVGHEDVTVVGEYQVAVKVPQVRPTIDQLVNGTQPPQST